MANNGMGWDITKYVECLLAINPLIRTADAGFIHDKLIGFTSLETQAVAAFRKTLPRCGQEAQFHSNYASVFATARLL